MSETKKIAFLLNSKDIHSVDWYKCALKTLPADSLYLITDITDDDLTNRQVVNHDNFVTLFPINKFLLFKGTTFGNKWRNLLKLVTLPLQAIKLKQFSKSHPDVCFHAIAIYYMFLANMAKVKYVGTPIGSELLVRPQKSSFYRWFAKKALRGAQYVTVDSPAMVDVSIKLSGVTPHIVQNGIDVNSIHNYLTLNKSLIERPNLFLSVRSVDYLYRIDKIINGRNESGKYKDTNISFIYPFYNDTYLEECKKLSPEIDHYYGRMDRESMYSLIASTKVVFSIPKSDSSPRSVYEAIFLGCAVIISPNKYFDIIPACMQQRLVITDINEDGWFDKSVEKAIEISRTPFNPTQEATDLFDQDKSFLKIYKLLESI